MPTPNPPMAVHANGLTMCASQLHPIQQGVVQAGELAEQAHHIVDHEKQQRAAADAKAQQAASAEGPAQEIKAQPEVLQRYLGV